MKNLPEKLAQAAKTAGTYSNWLNNQKPSSISRLPKKNLRKKEFISDLTDMYYQNFN